MKNQFADTFKLEAHERLVEIEAALLELEEAPDDAGIIGRVFRAMHTIKGSGSMFGFDDLAAFTHEIETVLDVVRSGGIPVTKKLIDLTLCACDHIRTMVEQTEDGGLEDAGEAWELIAGFKNLLDEGRLAPGSSGGNRGLKSESFDLKSGSGVPPGTAQPLPNPSDGKASAGGAARQTTYRIRFRPSRNIFTTGANPVLLLNELRQLGPCRVVAQTEAIPPLKDYESEACYTYWDIIMTTAEGTNAIRDVFIFVEDESELIIETIDERGSLENEAQYKKLGEILIERGDLSAEDLNLVLEGQKRIGEMLVEAGLVDHGHIESALAEQQQVREGRKERQVMETASTIRVPAQRLDKLVDLIGEMVTVQARLSQTAASHPFVADLLQIAEEVERLTAELRDNTMSIRMLPIGTTFTNFKRLVRDLSTELGKEIVLTTEGAETELDKTVIERLNDPLVHLIRNSIDHGIEPPDAREAAGKPRQGAIHLCAMHSGANVLIQIKDDGAGLDREAIRAKAIERGLIPPDAQLTEKELLALIFAPGFSTAAKVTGVSGRGVGMDVVKKSIESLRGTIDIDSSLGEGTSITLKLPLTLAIIDGLLVKIREKHFVLPLAVVEECIELTRRDVAKTNGRHMTNIRGNIVPYIRLRELFGINGDSPEIEQIVVTETGGNKVGFVVDQVIGGHQTVIKALGRMYRDVKSISGATILGDGTVALILDVPRLVTEAETMEQSIH